MTTFKKKNLIVFLSLAFGLATSTILTMVIWGTFIMGSWNALLQFNNYAEGFIELILFPLMTITCFLGLIFYREQFQNKDEVVSSA